MKDWIELTSTQRFWIQDPWIGDWEFSALTTRPLSKIQNYTSVCSYIKIRFSSLDSKTWINYRLYITAYRKQIIKKNIEKNPANRPLLIWYVFLYVILKTADVMKLFNLHHLVILVVSSKIKLCYMINNRNNQIWYFLLNKSNYNDNNKVTKCLQPFSRVS